MMDNQTKKIFISIGVVLVLLVVLLVILKLTNNDSNKIIENTNEGVIKSRVVDNVLFDDIKYTYDGEKTLVELSITNNNDKSIKIGVFTAKVYDKNNELINTFVPVCDSEIKQGEKKELKFSIKSDLSNAYTMEIELPNMEFVAE